MKNFTQLVKTKLKQTKKKIKKSKTIEKNIIKGLKKFNIYNPKFEDEELKKNINDDVQDAITKIRETQQEKKQRCPKGTRRNKKTGECE